MYLLLCSDGGAGSVLSGDKGFDEPAWGTFDINDDVDSVWDMKPIRTTKVCKFYAMLLNILFNCMTCHAIVMLQTYIVNKPCERRNKILC